jgi:ATP-dependent DNA helicase RecG
VTANAVDAALGASRRERGRALLGLAEDQWFDRKSTRTPPKELAIALVAFANAEGGVVVLGLHGGKVEGFSSAGNRINELRQAAIDFTVPPVRSTVEEVECTNEKGDTDILLVVHIEPSEVAHELTNGDCYLRVGDESRKLSFAQRQELTFDKGQSQYDGQPEPDVKMTMLDGKLLANYKSRVPASSSIKGLLRARGLITRNDEITKGGYLLFGDHPQDVFPQAHVRILRFLTTERGTGARLGIEEGTDFRIEGPIPRIVQAAQSKIEELMPRRRALSEAGTFEGTPIVPRDAWLEGLVNAVIHRSYSLSGDHIRVEIYPNRIEIESPGRFPGLADPSKPLQVSRFARNPRIARVCADLRIGQELGEGIKRIFEEMRRVGLTDPVYRQTAGSVKLSLAAIRRLDRRLAARLPSGSEHVLDVMRAADGPLGTGQLAELLALSRPALLYRLRALQSEDLIRWVGKSKQDPRAVWVLTN